MTIVTSYSYQTVTPVTYPTLTSVTGAIPLSPASGAMAHDIWLVVEPLQGGQYAVVLSAQGLQQSGSYLIEGVTRGTSISSVPLATTAVDSEFASDTHGNGIYWHVLASDPRAIYGEILLLYLPNMQMPGSQLVASAYLS